MQGKWVTEIQDACRTSGVPFFFKQWGRCDQEKSWQGAGRQDRIRCLFFKCRYGIINLIKPENFSVIYKNLFVLTHQPICKYLKILQKFTVIWR